MYNLRCHVGDVTTSQAFIMFSTLDSSSAVSLTCSGGSVAVGTITDRHTGGSYIGTGKVTITGLSAHTKYTYTITQGSESYSGSFWTMASDQVTKEAIIFATCTNWRKRQPTCYKDIRNRIESSEVPVKVLFHIDDVCYVDELVVSGGEVLPDSGGVPETTGAASDYAIAWAAWHGHEPTHGIFVNSDFQWCLRNVSWLCSGGDHAVAKNHCRGDVQLLGGEYSGCNKTLEATAIAEWEAFIGGGNPDYLTSGYLNWMKQIGPVRFVAFDEYQADPYDSSPSNAAEAKETHGLYNQDQLGDIFSSSGLDTSTVPFKCMLLPTGVSRIGQPANEQWTDETAHMNSSHMNSSNLDSTSGWLFAFTGDNHTVNVQSYDGGTGTKFWSFCPGTTGNSSMTLITSPISSPPAMGTVTGNARYYRSVPSGMSVGDFLLSAFNYMIIHADESTKRLENHCYEGGGNLLYKYQLAAETNNDSQWTNLKDQKVSF